MKRILLTAVLAFIGSLVFAQERIAVFPFEDMDNLLTKTESFFLYRHFSNEFTNKNAGKFIIIPRQDVEKLFSAEEKFQLSDLSAKAKTAETQRVLNGTQILSGAIGKVGNRITISVSLYTFPELSQLPGGVDLRVANKEELFDKVPDLVQSMQTAITGGTKPPDSASAVRDHINQGDSYYKEKNYALAIAEFTHAIKLDANNVVAYNKRGHAYLELDDPDRAIADYTQAILLNPNSSVLFSNRGYAYYYKALVKKAEFNYALAIADYTQAITLSSNDPDLYRRRGEIYGGTLTNKYSDYNLAITDYTQVIRLNPNDLDAYMLRALNYIRNKNYNLAIADYTQVIKLNPNYSDAYENRGQIYGGNLSVDSNQYIDYDLAIADYTQVIRLNPNYSSAYIYRAGYYERKKDYSRAIADYTQMIKLDPNDSFVYYSRGKAYKDSGDFNRAISDFETVLRLKPKDYFLDFRSEAQKELDYIRSQQKKPGR
jgi:tetratricopeptide (TPR) repeat protein